MRMFNRLSLLFVFALALGIPPLVTPSAQAQSSYYTSRGCVDCHTAPVVASCNGCHYHGNRSLRAATNKTSYTPGETVSVTLTSGSTRSGWIKANLYDQNNALVAASSGTASGMGGSTTFPATLTAPAPTAPGTYTWKMAYFGNQNGTGTADVHNEAAVVTNSFTVAAAADTTVPVVSAFTLPATSTSLTVPVSSFVASDNVAVSGYLVNTSATAPLASAAGWSASAPTSVTAAAPGSVTFYAWAKDAAGNVSLSRSAVVVITLPDTTVPVVSAFTLPATSTSLSVAISVLTATDNVAVSGYLVTTSATAPLASAAGWSAVKPTSVSAAAPGSVTFYAWAKDAAGNVSLGKSAVVVITLPDTAAPVVSAFTLPATSTSLVIPVSSFVASDNVAVTGYLVNTSITAPLASAAGWNASAPTSVTAPAAGSVTFYAWAKDAAGNVSLGKSAVVVVTLPDTTVPVVSAFTLPATSTSLTVPVSSFVASDNIAVSGYLVNTSATAPLASAAGWSASAPTSVTAPAAGSVTFYAWAKDAAGNVSLGKSAVVVVTLPVVDTAAPVVSAFTLPATSTSLSVAISVLTATDNVAVNGYLVTTSATAPLASAAGWSAVKPTSVTAAAPGSVTFYAWAKDAAGNVSLGKSAVVVVSLPVVDTVAPVISTFTLPATSASLTIPVASFVVTDNVAVSGYRITSSSVAPTTWNAVKPTSILAPSAGTLTFYAWARDAAGNVSQASSATVVVSVSNDITPPQLTLSTLENESFTNEAILNVSGLASDVGGLATVTVNGEPVSVNDDGSFTVAVPLIEGANVLRVVATDLAGNQKVRQRTIIYDPNAPQVTIAVPTDNGVTGKSYITVSGAVNERSRVTVAINGGTPQFAIRDGKSFTATVYLVAGINTITVTAKDPAGNLGSAKRTITFDNNKPTLAVTSPTQDLRTNSAQLTLTGSVNDSLSDVSVRIVMGDKIFTPAVVEGQFSQQITFGVAKQYAITVIAEDAAGNKNKVVRNVIYNPATVIDDDDDDDDDENDD